MSDNIEEIGKTYQGIIADKDNQIRIYNEFLIKLNTAMFTGNYVEVQRLLQLVSKYSFARTNGSQETFEQDERNREKTLNDLLL